LGAWIGSFLCEGFGQSTLRLRPRLARQSQLREPVALVREDPISPKSQELILAYEVIVGRIARGRFSSAFLRISYARLESSQ